MLHIDDEPDQSKFLEIFLKKADPNLVIEPALSAFKALELLEKKRYDCIVSDYLMPVMNGIQFAEKLREGDDTPLIIYTGNGSEEVAEAAFAAGIDDYVRKEMNPSHYKVLARRIRQVVEKKWAEEGLLESLRVSDAVLRSIPSSLLVYKYETPDRLILIEANPEALRQTNLKREDVIGKEFDEIWEYREVDLKTMYLDLIASGGDITFEKLYWKEKTIESYYRLNAFPIPGERVVVAYEDISERVRAEERLKKLYEYAAQIYNAETKRELLVSTRLAIQGVLGYSDGLTGFVENGVLIFDEFEHDHEVLRLPLDGGGISVRCINTGEVQFISDASKDPNFLEHLPARSAIAVPIKFEDGVVGVVLVADPEPYAFNETDRRVAETLGLIVRAAYRRLITRGGKNGHMGNPLGFLDHAYDAVLVATIDKIVYANGNTAELLGYGSPDELVDNEPSVVVDPRHWAAISEMFSAQQGNAASLNADVTKKDGGAVEVEINASPVNHHGEPAVVLFMREASADTEAMSRKVLTRDWLRSIYQESPVGIEIFDSEGNLIEANKADLEFFGVDSVEAFGGFNVFRAGGNLTEDRIEALRRGESVIHFEERNFDEITRYQTSRSGIGYFESVLKPIIHEDGKVAGYISIVKDVTELKVAENKLREYAEKLESVVEDRTRKLVEAERMATAGSVASMVGHDLRGPLQSIKNAVYMIRNSPEKAEKMYPIIDEAIDRSLKMLEELRQKTREEPLRLSSTDLGKLIGEVVRDVPTSIGVKVDAEIQPDMPAVMVDSLKIRRVIDNLVRNAVDAIGVKGSVKISAELRNRRVIVTVEDTGKGITDEELTRIFRPFYTTKPGGMGLGLPFCKRTVEAHGGFIDVESISGEGTKITVVLPIAEDG
ncbi:PAS domain S-box protein [Candidatus Bathyarchaeota archaeon]|nr:PAS domain S-box protein [Candidatus Bathyarchaeota archaeon]